MVDSIERLLADRSAQIELKWNFVPIDIQCLRSQLPFFGCQAEIWESKLMLTTPGTSSGLLMSFEFKIPHVDRDSARLFARFTVLFIM